MPSSTTTAAGETRDDNVKDGDDSIDDCGQDCANAVDDGHQYGTDGMEDALKLDERRSAADLHKTGAKVQDLRKIRRHPLWQMLSWKWCIKGMRWRLMIKVVLQLQSN